jgi:hypothetical protein
VFADPTKLRRCLFEGAGTLQIYIASCGSPLPLRIVETGAGRAGRPAGCGDRSGGSSSARAIAGFSNYNKAMSINAPADAIKLPDTKQPTSTTH